MPIMALLLACLVVCLVGPAFAQSYPSRPIKVIIPSSAGGPPDVFMRALGEELRKRLGQTLVIDNRPGGSFNIGTRACADAAPDGYTICMLPSEALVYNKLLFKTISYDPERAFAPITNAFFATQVVVVNAGLGVRSLTELAALSRSKPGTLSYLAAGVPVWAFMERWKKQTGADMVRVPFRGGGDAVNSVLSGTTPVAFSSLSNWTSYLEAGSIVALAVDAAKRLPQIPDVPTLAELGYTTDFTRAFFGIVAPAGTPRPIIGRIHGEVVRVTGDQAFRKRHLSSRALEPIGNTPDEFTRFLVEERAVSARIVRDLGLELHGND